MRRHFKNTLACSHSFYSCLLPFYSSMDAPLVLLKHAGLLWLVGFREACCLQRGFLFCRRSPELLKRTGQCFLLNGLIFLGSLFVLYLVINPILLWILPNQCQQFGACDLRGIEDILKFYSTLRNILIELFYIFWFYPLYVFSIILSNFWYNDIAKLGFTATGIESSRHNELSNAKSISHAERPASVEGVLIGIAEQAYSLLLVTIFFIEVYATGFIPYIGKAINFLLLSWMYAYYCFEYKWNLTQLALDKRLDFFESNWAFFLGFGSPCVLAIFFFSQLVSYGVMAILFPLFVLTALGTQEEQVIDFQRKSWRGAGLGRLPLFNAANTIAVFPEFVMFPENRMKVLHIIFGSPDKGNLAKKAS